MAFVFLHTSDLQQTVFTSLHGVMLGEGMDKIGILWMGNIPEHFTKAEVEKELQDNGIKPQRIFYKQRGNGLQGWAFLGAQEAQLGAGCFTRGLHMEHRADSFIQVV